MSQPQRERADCVFRREENLRTKIWCLLSARKEALLCGHKGTKRVLYPAGASSDHVAVRALDLLGQDFGKDRQDRGEALGAKVEVRMPLLFLRRSLSTYSCLALSFSRWAPMYSSSL